MRHVLTEKARHLSVKIAMTGHGNALRSHEHSDYDENTIPAGIGEVGCKVWPMTSALSLLACLLLRGVDGYVVVRVA